MENVEKNQLVSWKEAMEAWLEGKQICVIDEDGYKVDVLKYFFGLEGSDWNPFPLSIDTFKRGQWYILNDKTEEHEMILSSQQAKEFDKLVEILPDILKDIEPDILKDIEWEKLITTQTINIENLTFPNVKDSSDIEKAIKDLPKNIKQIIKGGIISGK